MNQPLPTNPELEAVLFEGEREEQTQAWAVYGDFLQSRGHPLGELVALEAELAKDEENSVLREAIRGHMDRIMESWSLKLSVKRDSRGRPDRFWQGKPGLSMLNIQQKSNVKMEWRAGLIRYLSIQFRQNSKLNSFLNQISKIFASPQIGLLRTLWIDFPSNSEDPKDASQPSDKSIVEIMANSLKNGSAGDYIRWLKLENQPTFIATELLDVTPILRQLPNLETLELQKLITTREWPNPRLSDLGLHSANIPDELSAMLSHPQLPELDRLRINNFDSSSSKLSENLIKALQNERLQKLTSLSLKGEISGAAAFRALSLINLPILNKLELHFGYNDEKPEVSNLREFFQTFVHQPHLPCLQHLRLYMKGFNNACLRELAKSPMLPNLHSLYLNNLFQSEEMLLVLLEEYQKFAHLKKIRMHIQENKNKLQKTMKALRRQLGDIVEVL